MCGQNADKDLKMLSSSNVENKNIKNTKTDSTEKEKIKYNNNATIKFKRFLDREKIKRERRIIILFIMLFLLVGIIENNLFLPNDGLGLLQHINIWIFLVLNLLIPIIINKAMKRLEDTVDLSVFVHFEETFEKNAACNGMRLLLYFSTTVGFCFFVGNSLQNANVINQLPFDYWDSANYIISYVISRCYKLYLFSYFIPYILVYIVVSIKSASELLEISDEEMTEYPMKNQAKFDCLCNFGLNILISISLSFILFSSGVYFIHKRFDITTIATMIVSTACVFTLISMYILLIHKYCASVIKYKEKHIKQINSELSKIHQYIFVSSLNEMNKEKLELSLKKEQYLWQIKERIEKLSKFPHIVKAIFTSVSPFIPTLLKIIFQLLNTFFKLEKLATIL